MDITLKEYNSEKKTPMVRGAVLSIILIAVLFLFIFIVGWFTSAAFPILIFIIFMTIPILVIFRNDLPNYMPAFVRNFVVTERSNTTTKVRRTTKASKPKETTTKTKQIYYVVAMSIITAMIVVLLYFIRQSVRPNATALESTNERAFLKIIVALLLTCLLGVLVLKFESFNKNIYS